MNTKTESRISLPILDERASAIRGEPVWSLEEWEKHHTRYAPKLALQKKHKRCDLPPPNMEAAKEFRTFPKYLQSLCTECHGDGSIHDPLIVGCKVYGCEVWPYRFGTNPKRTGIAPGKKAAEPVAAA